MRNVKRLIVSISLQGEELEIGELVNEQRKIYFKYYPEFIEKGMLISPFKLPLSSSVLIPDTDAFGGLFGVFGDSLPDGWGMLLLDRALTSKGISISEVTPLDRLSFVGHSGMGALIYKPAADPFYDKEMPFELDSIAKETEHVLKGASSDIIEELYRLGGSSGGARPKVLVGYHQGKDHLIFGDENLPEGYEHWIIKFPASNDPSDIAETEFAYYKMAIDAGIEMSQCHLLKGASGRQYFGTKRFDRVEDGRLHMHSVAGLVHDNYRFSNLDYGHVMDAAFRLEKHVEAYEKVLRLAAFNVFAHNRDDHSKNMAFLMDRLGHWKFAPAYDLTFSFSAHGFHSTTVAGEGRSPSSSQLMELAKVFGVKNAQSIIDEVRAVTTQWKEYGKVNGVSKESINLIENTLRIIK